jgi:hypothetical protein
MHTSARERGSARREGTRSSTSASARPRTRRVTSTRWGFCPSALTRRQRWTAARPPRPGQPCRRKRQPRLRHLRRPAPAMRSRIRPLRLPARARQAPARRRQRDAMRLQVQGRWRRLRPPASSRRRPRPRPRRTSPGPRRRAAHALRAWTRGATRPGPERGRERAEASRAPAGRPSLPQRLSKQSPAGSELSPRVGSRAAKAGPRAPPEPVRQMRRGVRAVRRLRLPPLSRTTPRSRWRRRRRPLGIRRRRGRAGGA